MGKDLIVGSAGLREVEDSLSAHLSGRRVQQDLEKWLAAEDDIAMICCLNLASVRVFLLHVAHCEGYSNGNAWFAAWESGKSKYGNMPFWDTSIWLPVEIAPGNLEDDSTVFVGSCLALLRELGELQKISQLHLGVAPKGYEEMRVDTREFYRSHGALQLDEADCVRWIWLALRDGAEMALKENTVLWALAG